MKLVIVTTVDEYKKQVIEILREAGLESFSKSSIEGFKTSMPDQSTDSWFAYERSSADSEMFFSFTEDQKIETLFDLIKRFNEALDSNNPLHAAVMPIERFI